MRPVQPLGTPPFDGGSGLAHIDWIRWWGDLAKAVENVSNNTYAPVTPSALTRANDTNVTVTLTGSPTVALLAPVLMTMGWTGVLSVARGGTGTGTAFTAGSVVFAGPSGVYAQDNANLFWNDTTNNLGLGTASPVATFRTTIDTLTGSSNAVRLRRGDNTRYRSDLGISVNGLTINAFDDTAVAALPIQIGAGGSTLRLAVNGVSIDAAGTTPTAKLHIAAGTTVANTAPIKLTSGALLTAAEIGAVEFLTDAYYATITTGAARKQIILEGLYTAQSALTMNTSRLLGRTTALAGAAEEISVAGDLSLSGGVLTGTAASTTTITDDTTTNATMFPVWVTAATGSLPLKVTSTKFAWNPSSASLGIGVAPSVTRNVNISTGSVTDTTGTDHYGVYSQATLAPSANSTASANGMEAEARAQATGTATVNRIVGLVAQAVNLSVGSGAVGDVRGLNASTFNQGASVITSLYGLFNRYGIASSGGITTARGIYLNPFISSSGNITTHYGIYIDAPTLSSTGVITTNYAIVTASGAGNIGFGTLTPTAVLHLKSGTATASTAPLKFTSGTLLGTAEAGAIEFLTDGYYATITTGAARKGIMLDDGTALTATRVPFATTNGRLTDDADLTFATDTLTATKLSAPTSVSTGTLAQTGKTTTYNNVATAGWGEPAIYGSARPTAQVAAVASVAAYTCGAADGSFIVSMNVNVTTSTTHNFTAECAYTDETNTARVLTMTFSQLAGVFVTAITNVTGAGPYEGVPMHIRVKASTAITLRTQAAGTYTTVTYNVEGLIEQVA